MQSRRTAGSATLSDGQLMLRCLLKIKDRREDRLRRKMAEITRQQMQTEVLQTQCQMQRTELTEQLNQILTWSGTLLASDLITQKKRMGRLFHDEHCLAQQQCSLSELQKRLLDRLSELQRELVIIMKKKEKLRGLLTNEYD